MLQALKADNGCPHANFKSKVTLLHNSETSAQYNIFQLPAEAVKVRAKGSYSNYSSHFEKLNRR